MKCKNCEEKIEFCEDCGKPIVVKPSQRPYFKGDENNKNGAMTNNPTKELSEMVEAIKKEKLLTMDTEVILGDYPDLIETISNAISRAFKMGLYERDKRLRESPPLVEEGFLG